ncbi:MAG: AsmA-like C-terminal region-containing protein [Bacteroidales bacterium]|nr:AsmA-like C-terminal region-containing protein [Bacteroidales bacterium]MDD3961986.1 AsmA-like C-terminal region-containing protein [Bacteroidales bacterium]
MTEETKTTKKIGYRRTIRFMAYSLAIAASLFLAGFAFLLIYIDSHDQIIKEVIIKQIDTRLNARLTLTSAKIDITKHFPDISLRLSGVAVTAPDNPNKMPPITQAESFFVRTDLISILKKEYLIKAILLEDAEINLFRSAEGKTNYTFHSTGSSDTLIAGKPAPGVTLPKLLMNRVTLLYTDEMHNTSFQAAIQKSQFKLVMNDSVVTLHMQLTGTGTIPGVALPADQPIDIMCRATYRLPEKEMLLSEGRIRIDDMVVHLSGTMKDPQAMGKYNVTVSGDHIMLQKALEFFPVRLREKLSAFQPQGTVSFNGQLYGDNVKSAPAFDFSSTLYFDMLCVDGNQMKLHDFSATCVAGAKPGNPEAFYLKLTELKTKIQHDGEITGWMALRHSQNLFVNTSLKSQLNLEEFIFLLPAGNYLSGTAAFDLQYKGTLTGLKENIAREWSQAEGKINIQAKNVVFQHSTLQQPIHLVNFSTEITPKKILIRNMEMETGSSQIALSGTITGLFADPNDKKRTGSGKLKLHANRINADELTVLFQKLNRTPSPENKKWQSGSWPGSQLQAELEIDHIIYNNEEYNTLFLQAKTTGTDLIIENFRLRGCEGSLSASGRLNDYLTECPGLTASVNAQSVNISSLFKVCNNFGLNGLTHENISGSITTSSYITLDLGPRGSLDMNTFTLDANLTITNGALKNFGPLMNFSGFLRLEDLSDIQFQTLENQFFIKNKTLYIPRMAIKNNVLDLDMEGRQKFSGEMDYHIDLALAELLSGKYNARHKDNQFGVIQEEEGRNTRIFIAVSGNTQEPKFKYDSPKARAQISKQIKKEKETLKSLFGRDTLPDSLSIPENSEKFQVKWDDDSVKNLQKTKKNKPEGKTGKKFEIDW